MQQLFVSFIASSQAPLKPIVHLMQFYDVIFIYEIMFFHQLTIESNAKGVSKVRLHPPSEGIFYAFSLGQAPQYSM